MSEMLLNFGPILAKANTLQNWPPVLEKHVGIAMQYSINALQTSAKIYAPAETFALYDSILPQYFSAFRARVYSDLPYSWRREEGFSGETDSLGRYFPRDPGAHYMRKSLSYNKSPIKLEFETEVNAALDELKGSVTGIMGWII